MAGLHPQSRRKGAARAVDMSVVPTNEPAWEPPPRDEWADEYETTLALPDASVENERVKLRMVNHRETDEMVQFALVQQSRYRSRWRQVVVVDSCHPDQVHLHRYSRARDERVGDPELIRIVREIADISRGYEDAYERVFGDWARNKRRWHDA